MNRFRIIENALIWQSRHETVMIEPWGPDSVRVRVTREPEIAEADWALLPPEPVEARIEATEAGAVLCNGKLTVRVAESGWIRFLHTDTGAILLEELPHPLVRDLKSLGGDLYRAEARFKAYEGEHLYGLGQHQHGFLDQKGCVIDLQQANTEVAIPFLVSSRGYGFLWHNPAVGRVELGKNMTRWVANQTRQLDYWVTAGNTPAEILEHYAAATGHPPMMPEWATGFWQCKLRYVTQEELLTVAREHKRRGLPMSVIVVDFFHWTMMGEWQFDPECWPDPAGMVRELEEMGIKLMVSVWPTVNPNSANYEEMHERGLLARNERGVPAQMVFLDNNAPDKAFLQYYDATNPEARQYIWEKVRENYYRYGIKVWWLDACEPEIYPMDHDNMCYHLGNGLTVGNIYPQMHERGFYEGMRAEGETEIISLCRSGWAGSQRYGAAIWSGDIPSTFTALQVQVRGGLNIAMSGIPWWTTDIGGFHSGDPEDPTFRELIVRWFQYGAFCPLFRLHGVRLPSTMKTGGPNEVWSFGEEAYGIIKDLLFLRERLRPYIAEQMRLAHERGIPPMRPLFVDFPRDDESYHVDDQFMFGPEILVAPVLTEGARSREVYLPAGTEWIDAWSGARIAGGIRLTAAAPLARIPVYLRGEALLPVLRG